MIDMQSIQVEVDAAYLYQILSENEADPIVADIFREMSQIEGGHALAFLKQQGLSENQMPKPSRRAKILHQIGKRFGYEYVVGVLLDTEKSISNTALKARQKHQLPNSISDTAHVEILRNVLQNQPSVNATTISRFEKRHRSIGGNALRAAVLGGNDGLVSNFSLVMGIAGATNGKEEVLLAGLAGLLAGALSMALGEWISVKSSQELYENQMALELEELEANPEGEKQELALIYRAKGIPAEQALSMATEVIADKEHAHAVLVQEELGIHAEELQGSAMEAALASFFLFAIGAIIPVIPFFFMGGLAAVLWSAFISAIGLFVIGASITLFTGKSVWYSGFRQVLFGLTAAAITYGIGKVIGVSVTG